MRGRKRTGLINQVFIGPVLMRSREGRGNRIVSTYPPSLFVVICHPWQYLCRYPCYWVFYFHLCICGRNRNSRRKSAIASWRQMSKAPACCRKQTGSCRKFAMIVPKHEQVHIFTSIQSLADKIVPAASDLEHGHKLLIHRHYCRTVIQVRICMLKIFSKVVFPSPFLPKSP